MWKFREILAIFILGLLTIPNNCDGRAVNISNTWTLPHDGFSVFYRFFRDQISWFEADAVCQFHHANLVTVDSSAEFDAAREFLRVLEVTEPVWIGLMRPQNSERFTWSNSKPLTITSENWAESLPLIDAPLCAVIDPIRDYRWHALRCGGPETASFLCEMNVPSWAEECILRDIPSLTIQYMADSGTVEITKDCGIDEGTIHQVCRGKQDQERIMKKLVCKNEQHQDELQNLFTKDPPMSLNINNMRNKILSKINKIPSDNNEDNNINTSQLKKDDYQSIQDQQTENPVQKLIEQFNVEELMQADQPLKSTDNNKNDKVIIDEIPKPVKKQNNKKVKSKLDKKIMKSNKKTQKLPQLKGKNIALEDMMMGDQPIIDGAGSSSQSLDNDDLNEIQVPLPHTKKSLSIDLKHHENVIKEKELIKFITTENPSLKLVTITNNLDTQSILNKNKNDNIELNLSVTKESITTSSIIDNESTTTSATNNDNLITEKSSEFDSTTTPNLITIPASLATIDVTLTTTEKQLSTIGHPMHPQQPRNGNINIDEIGGHQQHIKETNDNHFIPPMLMVKSHYTPPKSNHNEQQIDLKLNEEHNLEKSEILINPADETTTILTTETLRPSVIENNNNNDELMNQEKHISNDDIATTIKTILNSDRNLTEVTTIKSTILTSEQILTDQILTKNLDKLSSVTTTTIEPITYPTISPIDLTTAGTLITDGHQIVEIKIGNSDNPTTFSITTRAEPQQQQHSDTTKSITSDNDDNSNIDGDVIETSTSKISVQHHQTNNNNERIINNNDEENYKITTKSEINNDDLITPTTITNLNQLQQETIGITASGNDGNNKITSTIITSSPSSSSILENNFSSFINDETTEHQQEIKTFSNIKTEIDETTTGPTKIIPSTTTLDYHPTKVKQQSQYSNEENMEIYKPNRRRSLTKPENTSYLKKILG